MKGASVAALVGNAESELRSDPMVEPAPTATLVLDEEVEADIGVLRVLDGPDAGTQHTFSTETATLGSGEKADIVLRDPTVSRLHCELSREGRGVRLRDLGSKNGCWIDVCRVEGALLVPGAVLRVGSTRISTDLARSRVRRLSWRGGSSFGELIGASATMKALFARMARVAEVEVSIRIRGESGTGKELVAHALHDASPRRARPFVVVDCAALSTQLADLELFGHERGAFTGADRARVGAFERANGGTLFLDEIGELPLEIQPKLLRVLEDRTVQRIGSARRVPVDVRVLCATHQSLARRVNEGAFREDLLYRLGDVELSVPPLRERAGDVALIGRHVASELAAGQPDALRHVENVLRERAGYAWPGNVRELKSLVRRVVLLGEEGADLSQALLDSPARVRVDLPLQDARDEWVRAFERQYLCELLGETRGSVAAAADRAGVTRAWIYKMLERLGIQWRTPDGP